jgi:small subunit ribosomal protein S21
MRECQITTVVLLCSWHSVRRGAQYIHQVDLSVFDWLLDGEVMRLAEVRLQEGESLENALRRFKRKVQQEDIIKEVKRHSFYLKPGEKKRVKEALARKRARKKSRKESD